MDKYLELLKLIEKVSIDIKKYKSDPKKLKKLSDSLKKINILLTMDRDI